jgi:hypothetical protein
MIVTAQLMADAKALVDALQHAPDANGVLSALGVTELGKANPSNVTIYGGSGKFALTSVNKWATAFNEVIVYDQAAALSKEAHGSFVMPDLGPKALVSYTGSEIAAPVNPTDGATYRLQVDTTTATTLAWAVRPGGAAIPNTIMVATRVALGTFTTLPPDCDYSFATTDLFFAFLFTKTVWEPMTLIFSDFDNHEMRYPTQNSSYPTTGTPYQVQQAAKPYNFRRYFRGRGRLIFSSANQAGIENNGSVTTFNHLAMKGVDITLIAAAQASRAYGDATQAPPHYAVWLDRCHFTIQANFLVDQFGNAGIVDDRDDVFTSTRFQRCKLSQAQSSDGYGDGVYFGICTDDAVSAHWGQIQSCEIDGFVLAGYSANPTINESYFPAPAIQAYREAINLIGWRLVNTKGHSTNNLYADSVYEEPGQSTYARAPMTYTLVNCELWYERNLAIGSTLPGTSVNLNLVHSFVRVAAAFIVNDQALAPPLVKLSGSTLLADSVRLHYLSSMTNLEDVFSENVAREAMNVPGYVWLEDSSFGMAVTDGGVATAFTGDSSVLPVIYASTNSNVYLPDSLEYDDALVQLATDGTNVQLLSSIT